MTKHALWAAVAALSIVAGSSGCCFWHHHGCGPCGGCGGNCDSCGGGCGSCGGGCGSYGGGCGGSGTGSQYTSWYGTGSPSCDGYCGGCTDCCNDCHHHCFLWGLLDIFHCCHPETFDCGCQGCGEYYFCDWFCCPPTPDPCDCCGNFCGCAPCSHFHPLPPRCGSMPYGPPMGPYDGYTPGPGMQAPPNGNMPQGSTPQAPPYPQGNR